MRERLPHDRLAPAVAALAGFAALALAAAACSSAGNPSPTSPAASTPTAATSRPSPTAVVFPSAPASADEPVWDFVRQWQGADISPILRPTYVPAGIEMVTIGQPVTKQDPGLLSVEYTGPGKSYTILAGLLNPSSEGTPPTQAMVRGNPATVTTDNATIAVWWSEPNEKVIESGVASSGGLYEVFARGLTREDVLRVADSLAPLR